jgi:hypothetical protein
VRDREYSKCGLGWWEILPWRWVRRATTPPKKNAWWWKQLSKGSIASLSIILDQALFFFLICVYFWCYLSWNLEEAVEHLTVAILLNPNSATVCYSWYVSCINNSVGRTALAWHRK